MVRQTRIKPGIEIPVSEITERWRHREQEFDVLPTPIPPSDWPASLIEEVEKENSLPHIHDPSATLESSIQELVQSTQAELQKGFDRIEDGTEAALQDARELHDTFEQSDSNLLEQLKELVERQGADVDATYERFQALLSESELQIESIVEELYGDAIAKVKNSALSQANKDLIVRQLEEEHASALTRLEEGIDREEAAIEEAFDDLKDALNEAREGLGFGEPDPIEEVVDLVDILKEGAKELLKQQCNLGFRTPWGDIILWRNPDCQPSDEPELPEAIEFEDFPGPPEIDEDDLPPGAERCDLCSIYGRNNNVVGYRASYQLYSVTSSPTGRSGSYVATSFLPFCLNSGVYLFWKQSHGWFSYRQSEKDSFSGTRSGFYRFRFETIEKLEQLYPPLIDQSSSDPSRGITRTAIFINTLFREDCQFQTPPTPPIPPIPRPNPNEPMTCCAKTQQLLKLLLIEMQRQNLALGVDEFVRPGEAKAQPKRDLPYAPERLVEIRKTGHKGKVHLRSLTEVLEFQIRQVDRAVGNLPIRAKVADADPTQPGEQTVEVEIQTLADGLRENLETTIESAGDLDLTNLLVIRALFELGYIHQGSVQSWYMLDAICDYLDFRNHEKQVKVPFAFDPRAGQKQKKGFGASEEDEQNIPDDEQQLEKILPKLLKETDVPIKVREWHKNEKKSLNDLVQEILRHAINAAAGVTEKASPERLDELVAEAQAKLQLASLLNKSDIQQALTSGKLRRGKG
ncbi:MAG: hypothetical protein F6J87_28360 [Spirulina sp. SIO3F2]|nr:hypothetical protein [Spirulina sp. SIO3F2]